MLRTVESVANYTELKAFSKIAFPSCIAFAYADIALTYLTLPEKINNVRDWSSMREEFSNILENFVDE